MTSNVHRFFLGFYSAVWVFACSGLIALAWNDTKKLDIDGGNFDLEAFITTDGATRWAFTALMVLVAIPGLVTFAAAITGPQVARLGYLLARLEGGDQEVPVASLAAMIEPELQTHPAIRRASLHAVMRRGGVDAHVHLLAEEEAGLEGLQAFAAETTAMILREELGRTEVRPVRVTLAVDVPPPPIAVNPEPVVYEEDDDEVIGRPRLPYIDWGDGRDRRAITEPREPWHRP